MCHVLHITKQSLLEGVTLTCVKHKAGSVQQKGVMLMCKTQSSLLKSGHVDLCEHIALTCVNTKRGLMKGVMMFYVMSVQRCHVDV